MIVGVVPVGVGVVAVKQQFFNATDVTDGVSKYVNGYTPPLNPANFVGFDTGWISAQTPTPGKQWAYDRTNLLFVEIDVDFLGIFSTATRTLSGTVTETLPRAATATARLFICYTNATNDLTLARAVGTDTINGTAGDLANLPAGTYVAIPTSITNWLVIRVPQDPTATVQAGRNGATIAGAFYRGVNGMTLDALTRGFPVPAGKLSFLGWTRSDAVGTPVLEVLNNGVVIATLANPSSGAITSTPKVAVAAGLLSFRNQLATAITTQNVQITAVVS